MSDSLNDKITRVMDMSERLKPCCRSVMLRMAGGWVKDVEQLQASRNVAVDVAEIMAAAINTVLDDYTRDLLWQVIRIAAQREQHAHDD